MQLINVTGLSLFGPGSEWFWSMLQFVIVAITLIAIYRRCGCKPAPRPSSRSTLS